MLITKFPQKQSFKSISYILTLNSKLFSKSNIVKELDKTRIQRR